MAKTITPLPTRPPRTKYNWDEILDGAARIHEYGADFTCEPKHFSQQARTEARKRDIQVDVRPYGEDGDIYVRAIVPGRVPRSAGRARKVRR